jgi:hypothetical protein
MLSDKSQPDSQRRAQWTSFDVIKFDRFIDKFMKDNHLPESHREFLVTCQFLRLEQVFRAINVLDKRTQRKILDLFGWLNEDDIFEIFGMMYIMRQELYSKVVRTPCPNKQILSKRLASVVFIEEEAIRTYLTWHHTPITKEKLLEIQRDAHEVLNLEELRKKRSDISRGIGL